jgi:RNA polymerase sigma factor FliA
MRAHARQGTERQEWKRYRATGDVEARNRLVERHVRLVYHFAQRLSARSGAGVEVAELVSAGVVGLLSAVSSFDPDRGYRFSTFAGARIRGAMLDELRSRDGAPRSVRRKEREMERASARLSVELERTPAHPEVARVLGVDASTLWRWKWDVARNREVSFSEGVEEAEGVEVAEGVEDRLTREAEVRRLRRELGELSERERLVVELYDMQSWKLREIADSLGVTESRVSQIRAGALRRLRSRMRDLRVAA